MELIDSSGNTSGGKLEICGPDGKPKWISGGGGGGTPLGPAGGDLSGTYPDPLVIWANGSPLYDLQYYSISNPNGYISGIVSAEVIAALGYTPYDSSNPDNYITIAALTPYLTSSLAALTYQPIINLTTTGSSGPATLIGDTLNVPEYGGGGGGASIIKLTSQTLLSGGWVLAGGYYTYTFSNVNITPNTRVDFTPDNISYTEITTCGILPKVDVAIGTCTFYSLFPPQSNIAGEVTIFPTV